MKTLFTTLLFTLFLFTSEVAFSQKKKSNVPDTILKALEIKFPGVEVASWEHEGNFYEATFEINHHFFSALFEGTGRLILIEEDLDPSNLPEVIKTYVLNNLKGKKVREAAKITDGSGRISYSLGTSNHDYLFDSTGNLIRSHH